MNLSSLKPDKHGEIRLKPGVYLADRTIEVRDKRTYRAEPGGRVVIRATTASIGTNRPVFDVQGGELVTVGVDFELPNRRIGVKLLRGQASLYGESTTIPARISGGGQLIEALQCDACVVADWRYIGRPFRYVGFFGDPMQRSNPKWGLDGIARNVRVQNVVATESSHHEALFRYMFAYGVMTDCVMNNEEQQSPGVHKQAIQLRGSHLFVQRCAIRGSIAVGPLDAAKETPEYRAVAHHLPRAAVFITDCEIGGYVEVASDTDCVIQNSRIVAKDPRASGRTTCIYRKKLTGRDNPNVWAANVVDDGAKYRAVADSGINGHDARRIMDVFSRAMSGAPKK